jgi:Transposase DDE domain
MTVRKMIQQDSIQESYRNTPEAFTRQRKLPFSSLVLLVLQKSVKSLQLRLHEFFRETAEGGPQESATASAYTQARAKLSHKVFIELNNKALLKPLEASLAHCQRWQGHRLLGIDSSKLRLPDEDEIWDRFGGQEPVNQSGACGVRVPMARLSVLFDLLNDLGLETRVEPYNVGEIDIAQDHLLVMGKGDLGILDRGFAGYELFAKTAARGADFVCRCSKGSFGVVSKLFARNEAGVSLTVRLKAPARAIKAGLPSTLLVRFVTLRLPTGELEVLATSLLDEAAYPAEVFGWVYHQRWGIETYYGVLKGRLDLENFTGLTTESVLQDIHAAVFLTNLETVLTGPVVRSMPAAGENGRKHALQVNRSVSFHAIKFRMIDLLIGTTPLEQTVAELQRLFQENPVPVRPDRHVPRKAPSTLRSLNYQKRVKKSVY